MNIHPIRRRAMRWLFVAGTGVLAALTTAAADSEDGPATDHVVVMGAVDPAIAPDPNPPFHSTRTDRFEYLAYYPSHLQVHRGDTVEFRRDGFHSFTFTPEGDPLVGWPRKEEGGHGVITFDPEPIGLDCGYRDDLPPCPFTGEDPIDSMEFGMRLAIDAPAGTYTYYCRIHSGMNGVLEVVPDTAGLPTPGEIEAQRELEVAADTARAEALIEANQTPEIEVDEAGRVTWSVKAGDITADGRVSVLRFMPSNLVVAPGDRVEYVAANQHAGARFNGERAADFHSVSFVDGAFADTVGLAAYFLPACDPDDPYGGVPGLTGVFFPVGFDGVCPPAWQFELQVSPTALDEPVRAPGDEVRTGVVHDSGILVNEGGPCRVACNPWTGEPLPSQLPATFPEEGVYPYTCLFHHTYGMSGSIVVDP